MKKKVWMLLLFVGIMFITSNVFAYNKCPNSNLDYVGCGSGSNMVTGIPAFVPRLTSFAITLMHVLIPVILIVTATIEMFKSIISGNPDNVAKCRKRVISKYIGALLAFFIISFITNIVKLIARGNEKSVAAACFNCYLNNKCTNDETVCKGVGGAADSSKGSGSGSSGSSEAKEKCLVLINETKSNDTKKQLLEYLLGDKYDYYVNTSMCETKEKRSELKAKLIEIIGEEEFKKNYSIYFVD